jgi:hypothetical protein
MLRDTARLHAGAPPRVTLRILDTEAFRRQPRAIASSCSTIFPRTAWRASLSRV